MKQIFWITPRFKVRFKVNWFEYLVLKRIFKKKNAFVMDKRQFRGERAECMVVDEYSNIDFETGGKKE